MTDLGPSLPQCPTWHHVSVLFVNCALEGSRHSANGAVQTAENFPSTTYLTQVLLFLLHSNFAPLGSLLPPLSLFLRFFLVRGIKSPLPTRGSLERGEREEKEPRQSLRRRKLLSGLKELQSEACMCLTLYQGSGHLTLLSV